MFGKKFKKISDTAKTAFNGLLGSQNGFCWYLSLSLLPAVEDYYSTRNERMVRSPTSHSRHLTSKREYERVKIYTRYLSKKYYFRYWVCYLCNAKYHLKPCNTFQLHLCLSIPLYYNSGKLQNLSNFFSNSYLRIINKENNQAFMDRLSTRLRKPHCFDEKN